MAKAKRNRTLRREAVRKLGKLGKDRERLFLHGPGGTPERPIAVDSPSVVELRARSTPCPRCEGEHEVAEHAAVSTSQGLLREARLRCRRCGSRRSLWFRLPLTH